MMKLPKSALGIMNLIFDELLGGLFLINRSMK